MKKNIKNYTSSVPANQSMMRIEELLTGAGATEVNRTYDGFGGCDSMVFKIAVPGVANPVWFKIPSKVDKCKDALWRNYLKTVKKPSEAMKETISAQAARTAWKLMHEWVEIQITLIELDQVEVMEAFMQYLYNPETQQTFFEHSKSKSHKLLLT